jgi:3-hexulose-6-phosphate synthase
VKILVESGKTVDVVIIGRAIVNDPSPSSKFVIINNILKQV